MKSFFFLFLLFTVTLAFSQVETNLENENDCAKYRSLYYEYLKQNMYDDARRFWLKAEDLCGGLEKQDERFFKNGIAIYKGLRKTTPTTDSTTQNDINDTISFIYKTGLQIYQDEKWGLEYAFHLYYFSASTNNEIEDLFKNVHVLKENTPGQYIETYFRFLIKNKFNMAEPSQRKAGATLILKDYFLLREYCRLGFNKAQLMDDPLKKKRQINAYEKAENMLNQYIVKVPLQPQDINEKFLEAYESYSTDTLVRLKQIESDMELLEKLKATDLLIYKELVYEHLEIKPTSKGYLSVGDMELSGVNNNKALKAYEIALSLLPGNELEAEINYKMTIALYQLRQYKEAFRITKRVNGVFKGKALKMAGDCIVALVNTCGESTFERKANYWLANDYYKKAIESGERLSSDTFSKLWPTNGACFEEGVALGTSYKLLCWGETTIIR